MDVLLANPRGFCAGVERAISIVERALAIHGAPIYVRHEVVHNKYVVEDLKSKGAAIVEALKARFPAIAGPKKNDICYATQNRQDAVKFMAQQCDVVLVVGSPNSSNSNRLREVAQSRGIEAHMVDNASELKAAWIAGKRRIGVTAGASAPEILVQQVIAGLRELGADRVTVLSGTEENVVFPMPKGLASI